MRTATLHRHYHMRSDLSVGLRLLGLLLLLLFAIAFQLYQSRQNSYLPYDAQESEAK